MRHTASGLQMCKNARRYVARCLVTSFFKAGFQSYNALCCAHKRLNILVTAEFVTNWLQCGQNISLTPGSSSSRSAAVQHLYYIHELVPRACSTQSTGHWYRQPTWQHLPPAGSSTFDPDWLIVVGSVFAEAGQANNDASRAVSTTPCYLTRITGCLCLSTAAAPSWSVGVLAVDSVQFPKRVRLRHIGAACQVSFHTSSSSYTHAHLGVRAGLHTVETNSCCRSKVHDPLGLWPVNCGVIERLVTC